MCDIGTPLEIIDVQPLNLPVPLRREAPLAPEPITVPVEVPVAETVIAETV